MVPLFLLLATSGVLITGTIRDSSGAVIPDARVYLRDTDSFCASGADGRFNLTGPTNTQVTLVAVHAGFRAAERQILLAGESLSLDLTLEVEARAEQVDVHESSTPAPQALAEIKLDTLDVYRTPGTDADIMRALQMLPGVSKIDEGAGLYVRGGDVSETATYLDHALLFHPYRYETPSGGFFGSVDPYQISGLSLSTGGFPARYGDALSGVLELTGLDRPDRASFYGNLGLGAASASVALPLGERFGLRFSGNRSLSRLLFDVNPGHQHFDRLPAGTDLNFSFYADGGRFGRFKFSAFADREQVGVESQQDAFTGILNSSSRNRLFSLDWQKSVGDWSLEATASIANFRNQVDIGVLDLIRKDTGDRVRVDLTRRHANWTLRTGTEAERRATISQGVTPLHGADFRGSQGTRQLSVDQNSWRSGVYVELEHAFGRITWNAGIRGDRDQSIRAWSVDPRTSLSLALTRRQRVRLAWGIYHQAPSPEYSDPSVGNPHLSPMRATHLVTGYEFGQESGPVYVRVEGYRKQYRALPLQNQATNFDDHGFGFARGLDVFLKFAPGGAWQAWAGYSFLNARRLYTPFDQYGQFAIPTAPYRPDFDIPHTLQLSVQHSLTSSISAAASFRAASGKPFTPVAGSLTIHGAIVPVYGPINSDRLPVYQRLDLSLSKTRALSPHASIILYLGVANATNHHNIFAYAYNNDFTQRRPAEGAWERAFYFGAAFQH